MDYWICKQGVKECNGGSCILFAVGQPNGCPYIREDVEWRRFDTNYDFKQNNTKGEYFFSPKEDRNAKKDE